MIEKLIYSLIIEELKVTAEGISRRISTVTFDNEDVADRAFKDHKQKACEEAESVANNIILFTCEEVIEGKDLVIKLIYKNPLNPDEKINIKRIITKTEGYYFFEEGKESYLY